MNVLLLILKIEVTLFVYYKMKPQACMLKIRSSNVEAKAKVK